MKKVISVLLAVLVLCSFAGCKKTEGESVNGTPAQTIFADFKAKVKDDSDIEALANELLTNGIIPFQGATMPVEAGFLNGFKSEINGFEKGVMFSPVIGTIPFVGYIFKLADGADIDAFKKTLRDNADLRWNICTEADEMICEAEGSLVFFIMAPASFEEA